MIEVKLCFAAEATIRDAETNTVSVFNLLEDISAMAPPFVMPRLSFFTLLERAANDADQINGHFRLQLNDNDLVTSALTVSFAGKLRTRAIVNLGGIFVPSAGLLRFRLELGTTVAEYNVDVLAIPPTVQTAVAPPQ